MMREGEVAGRKRLRGIKRRNKQQEIRNIKLEKKECKERERKRKKMINNGIGGNAEISKRRNRREYRCKKEEGESESENSRRM